MNQRSSQRPDDQPQKRVGRKGKQGFCIVLGGSLEARTNGRNSDEQQINQSDNAQPEHRIDALLIQSIQRICRFSHWVPHPLYAQWQGESPVCASMLTLAVFNGDSMTRDR